MVIKKIFFAIIIVVFSLSLTGQIVYPGEPFSSKHKLLEEVIFTSFNQRTQLPETDSKLNAQPLYAGYTLPFTEKIAPNWERNKTGGYAARFGITVTDAQSLNLYLSDFFLEEEEKVFIYDPRQKLVIGALTEKNNGEYLATSLIGGDSLILELNSPKKSTYFPFTISEIGVVGNNIPNSRRDFGDAGSCEILMNCPEGDDWQKEKNGVARILVKEGNSLYWCSGSLVNNTRQDGTPYFLTANHCGDNSSAANYDQWIFYFNYESPDCEFPSEEPALFSMTGAKLLSNASGDTDNGSDFKLLLLKENVPLNYKPFYNGWNRTDAPSSSGVDIHHPEGDLKMISTYLTPTVSSDYLGSDPGINDKYWEVVWSPTNGGFGVTEGGSSGSPLFNSQGQIIGALTGGRASCTYPEEEDYFGKFSYSWNSNGNDSASQLSVWLDPGNSGVMFLNGSNLDTVNLNADFRAEYTNILIGGSVNFINNSSGKISQYEWNFPGGYPDYSGAEQPGLIQYNSAGMYDVKLKVISASGEDQIVRHKYIQVMPSISPNPGRGQFNINFGNLVPDDLQIEVFDIIGQKVPFFITGKGISNVIVDISSLADNIYFIKTKTNSGNQTFKLILSR